MIFRKLYFWYFITIVNVLALIMWCTFLVSPSGSSTSTQKFIEPQNSKPTKTLDYNISTDYLEYDVSKTPSTNQRILS